MDFGFEHRPCEPRNLVYPLDGPDRRAPLVLGRESPEPPRAAPGLAQRLPGQPVRRRPDRHEHTIIVDGTDRRTSTHIFLAPGDARAYNLLVDEFFLYTHRPLAAKTRYRVRLAGDPERQADEFDWTFTTR